MSKDLPKQYNPRDVEDKWYNFWLEKKFFHADPASDKKAYSIVIPPPNVTGVLTMGHVLNNTIQDILARRKRMQGYEVLWLPGTDHAGIATQTVVERTLREKGEITHRDDLGRERFIEKVWEWKERHGDIIVKQLRKLGCSCDWDRFVFTMDGLDPKNPSPRVDYSKCVEKVFVDLYKKGLIYKGKRMVNWCVASRTALSDEEVEMREVRGHLWYIKYPLLDPLMYEKYKGEVGVDWRRFVSDEFIVVATTRPETMLGDEAVAVSTKDLRYTKYVGRYLLLPLVWKPIPVIADEAVDAEFGTGAVKVTPAHDPVDYEISLRHNLPITQVIGEDGRMTPSAGERYRGLDRFECRDAVIYDLKNEGLLQDIKDYTHNVGYSQRAGVPIEPMLSTQWFLKYPSVKRSLDAVLGGEIRFFPDRWTKVYSHWMENIKDWCISRQLWWGHRIPAWYCEEKKTKLCEGPIVDIKMPDKCPHCGGVRFVQDEDVLDTWFSSWLWPFATMGWPEKTPLLQRFYPTTDLVTGPDIIFFWVARMIMAGYEFMGEKPFENVYFTGIIRDEKGRKMSKSLGNSPDPLALIEKYGADGLRFGLMMIAPKGQDILFSEERIEVGRNFINKLWNASRFVFMQMEHLDKAGFKYPEPKTLPDKWIINRLHHAVCEVNDALDHYQFDSAARVIYRFVWGEWCDWYIEFAKVQLKSEEMFKSTISVLTYVLDNILRLLHPYAPFVTEEIFGYLKANIGEALPESIMYAPFPNFRWDAPWTDAARSVDFIIDVITAIRNIKGEHNVPLEKKIDVLIAAKGEDSRRLVDRTLSYIRELSGAGSVSFASEPPHEPHATAVVGDIEVFVPFSGMVDLAAEKARLSKEIGRVESYIARLSGKLSNSNFLEKAPPDIVEAEKEKLKAAEQELEKLRGALIRLER